MGENLQLFLFRILKILYLIKGIVIYGPATALSLLTPLSTEVSVLMIGIIATFYTVNSF